MGIFFCIWKYERSVKSSAKSRSSHCDRGVYCIPSLFLSVNYLLTGMVHQNQYAPSQSESLHSTKIRSICLFDCFPDLVTGVTLLNIHLIVSFIFIQVICFFDSVHCSVHSLIG